MRLRIGRDSLADAVAWAARALPSRPVLPILAGLLLDAGDSGGITLSCFDYEVSARVGAEAAVAEQGRALVSGRLLAEIARSLPPLPVDLATEGDNLVLTCGSARFTLLTLPTQDYPALPEVPPPAGRLDGGEFATAVGQVVVAAGRDDTLPMLTGVLTEIDGAALTLVATDRYRMAVRELDWQPARPGIRASALVPARTLAEAARTMAAGSEVIIGLEVLDDAAGGTADGGAQADGGPLGGTPDGYGYGGAGRWRDDRAGAASGLIGFEHDARRFTTRLLGTEFITYKSRFPRDFAARAELAGPAFAEAIRRVALVADRESRLLLTFADGVVVIETGSGEGSRAIETVDAAFEGEDGFTIAFKPHYLLDGIIAAGAGHGSAVAAGARAGPDASGASGATGRPAGQGAGGAEQDGGRAGGAAAHTRAGGAAAHTRAGGAAAHTRAAPGRRPATADSDAADRAGQVRLEFTSPEKPAVITGGPGFRYLLAPMRT